MMKKRKIWKSIGAIILLLMFHVDAMATDYPFDGVSITINDNGTAVVSLSASGAIGDENNFYGLGKIRNLPWGQVYSITFKSENEQYYSSDDWAAIAQIINLATPDTKTVALDFSRIFIEDGLFTFQEGNNEKITSVVMPNGLTTLANNAFNGCTSLNNVGWSPALTSIGATAFYNTGFTSITIPEGVTSIGEYNQEIKGEMNVEIIPVSA